MLFLRMAWSVHASVGAGAARSARNADQVKDPRRLNRAVVILDRMLLRRTDLGMIRVSLLGDRVPRRNAVGVEDDAAVVLEMVRLVVGARAAVIRKE